MRKMHFAFGLDLGQNCLFFHFLFIEAMDIQNFHYDIQKNWGLVRKYSEKVLIKFQWISVNKEKRNLFHVFTSRFEEQTTQGTEMESLLISASEKGNVQKVKQILETPLTDLNCKGVWFQISFIKLKCNYFIGFQL